MTKMPTTTNRINPPITVPTISPTDGVVASGSAFSGSGIGAGGLSYDDGTVISASPSGAFSGSGSGASGLSYDHGTVVGVSPSGAGDGTVGGYSGEGSGT